MADLNGAYYGPPVPPQQKSYHSHGRRSSCGPCCLLCTLFKFLISIVIVLGVVVLALWLVFRPNEIKVYVEEATLTQFNLSNTTNNLQYNLSLTTTIRNPNRRIGIHYDQVQAQAEYAGSRFAYAPLPAFYQGHKNTTTLRPVFIGSQVMVSTSVPVTYAREKGEGYYTIDVKLYPRVRLNVWFLKIRVKPDIDCVLRLPEPGTETSSSGSPGFQRTKCHVDFSR